MPNTHKKRILIVEDEPELAAIYETLLKDQAGYDVRVAHNGKDALKLAREDTPDLILLDLRMPVMDGVEFLKEFNLKESYPQVKVIVFSNYDMQDEIDDAYRFGADRYVLKAWASPKELLQIVSDGLQ